MKHVGSAHTDAELQLLLRAASELLNPGQGVLDLGPIEAVPAQLSDVSDWTAHEKPMLPVPLSLGRPKTVGSGSRVISTAALTLWNMLLGTYSLLGFDALGDEAFRALVLARIIEPTSKADTVRVLKNIGAPTPGLNTLYRALGRCQERDYRGRLATAAMAHSVRTTGKSSLILYDVTTLHFETENEDVLRKLGMSKERRVDPQVQVGLLVDPGGFPLEVHLFEGNKAETTTIVPVLEAFQERHSILDLVVVADAGMLSAGNLNSIEDAGFNFIGGSRISKAPYDLADHFDRHGDFFTDGQILESVRTMGTGKNARERRIVYQWSFQRQKRDDRNINLMIERAEKIAAGKVPMRKARFLKVTGAERSLDQSVIDRARQVAGLKGYVTNLPTGMMHGSAVIGAYHDLWQVEASFRMTKSDLRARPVFHRQRDAIQAHLTIVFAALAISRHLQEVTGVSIKKIVKTLEPVRSATVEISGQQIQIEPQIPPEAQELLDAIRVTKATG